MWSNSRHGLVSRIGEGLAERTLPITVGGLIVSCVGSRDRKSFAPRHLARVDGYLRHLPSRGLSRSLGHCRQKHCVVSSVMLITGMVSAGSGSRDPCAATVFNQENVPTGPKWPEVQRLIAATKEARARICAIERSCSCWRCMGCAEGRSGFTPGGLGLDASHVLQMRRSKSARVQEYPLTRAMRQALRRYTKEARPRAFTVNCF